MRFSLASAAPLPGTDVSAAFKADPYEVLGVPADAAVGAVKKRYWRLSLMIHPDKCRHPRAAEAFQAAAAAAKLLQVRACALS
jgi:DnaJ family protein C protein 8